MTLRCGSCGKEFPKTHSTIRMTGTCPDCVRNSKLLVGLKEIMDGFLSKLYIIMEGK